MMKFIVVQFGVNIFVSSVATNYNLKEKEANKMFFRYWMVDGKATVIEDVDRIVFDSLINLQYRRFVADRYDWNSLKYGIDYLQFTMSKE